MEFGGSRSVYWDQHSILRDLNGSRTVPRSSYAVPFGEYAVRFNSCFRAEMSCESDRPCPGWVFRLRPVLRNNQPDHPRRRWQDLDSLKQATRFSVRAVEGWRCEGAGCRRVGRELSRTTKTAQENAEVDLRSGDFAAGVERKRKRQTLNKKLETTANLTATRLFLSPPSTLPLFPGPRTIRTSSRPVGGVLPTEGAVATV